MSIFIKIIGFLSIFLILHHKVIRIHKILSRIIRRIDIDHLHFPEIAFLKNL